ncbi:MAG: hypothetical protein LC733_07120 [Actinobacteria bacterium]|nr:hypothetical protein [Actinomycetota bacterium]
MTFLPLAGGRAGRQDGAMQHAFGTERLAEEHVGLPKPRRGPALGTAAALPEPPRLDCAP